MKSNIIYINPRLPIAEIATRYGVAKSTASRARRRGWIQKREKRGKVSNKGSYYELLETLHMRGINTKRMAEDSDISYQSLCDALRDSVPLAAQEYKKLRTELNKLKASLGRAAKYPTRRKMLAVLNNTHIRLRPVLSQDFTPREYDRIMRFRRRQLDELDSHEYDRLAHTMKAFALQL